MSIVEKFRKIIELSKLARRYTINSNEIMFNVIKNGILEMLGKQHGPTKIITKDGKHYITINPVVSIYSILKLLDAGWTIADNSEKITLCYQSKNPCISFRRENMAVISEFKDIFVDKVYGERFHGTVIDVGAFIGDSSIYFAINGAEREL